MNEAPDSLPRVTEFKVKLGRWFLYESTTTRGDGWTEADRFLVLRAFGKTVRSHTSQNVEIER